VLIKKEGKKLRRKREIKKLYFKYEVLRI